MPVTTEVVRDPPSARWFRRIVPILVVLALLALALAPGLMIEPPADADSSPAAALIRLTGVD